MGVRRGLTPKSVQIWILSLFKIGRGYGMLKMQVCFQRLWMPSFSSPLCLPPYLSTPYHLSLCLCWTGPPSLLVSPTLFLPLLSFPLPVSLCPGLSDKVLFCYPGFPESASPLAPGTQCCTDFGAHISNLILILLILSQICYRLHSWL